MNLAGIWIHCTLKSKLIKQEVAQFQTLANRNYDHGYHECRSTLSVDPAATVGFPVLDNSLDGHQ